MLNFRVLLKAIPKFVFVEKTVVMDFRKMTPSSNRQDAPSDQTTVLHDFLLRENMARIAREQIPERAVYAKGSGAYGTFTVSRELSAYTQAKLFSKAGNSCKIFTRFSTLGSEKGSPDAARDLRGFAIKFYTEEGNWDLVGNNTPVFFINDPKKFPDFITSHKKLPKTNLKCANSMWDFYSQNPESLHQIIMLMSDRGTPKGYRHMNGYGSHTFSMINEAKEKVWVKFHLKTQQGIQNFSREEAIRNSGEHPDSAQEDLCDAIEQGNFPSWIMYIQVMTEEQAKNSRWNPFDVTKVWFQDEFPLMEIGKIELNEIPSDYFSHVEQAAFAPSNLIPGIGFSPDKMLQARLFSYPDSQRHRIGINAGQIQVNQSPFTGNQNPSLHQNEMDFSQYIAPETDEDHYTQPGLLYTKVMNNEERNRLIHNIIESMKEIKGSQKDEIINRQLCHFFRANIEMGMKIAMGLQINIDANTLSHAKV